MYSWGPDCKLVNGAYGGVTFDSTKQQFVHACESWTPDRLPYSCTPLRLLPISSPRLQNSNDDDDNDNTIKIEEQVDNYNQRQRAHQNGHIPEDVLRAVLTEDKLSRLNDPLPRHNRLQLSTMTNYNHDRIIIASHLHDWNKLKMTRLYELPEPYNNDDADEVLVDNYTGRPVQTHGSITKTVSAQSSPVMAALTSTSQLYTWSMTDCRTLHPPITMVDGDEAMDVDVSTFGNRALFGTRSGCRLFDLHGAMFSQHWPLPTVFGVKHAAILCEYTNVASSVNKLFVLDNRSDRHVALPFDIGGSPLALQKGNNMQSLLFLSGPERLAAIDLRRPKCPVVQWQHKECFGGRLGMLKAVPFQSREHGHFDILTGVNLDTHELVMVPVKAEPQLNTVSVLSPVMQSTVNVNRAFLRLKHRQPIIGHDWIQLHDDHFLSVHMYSNGQMAYQFHSFSHKFTHTPIDQADWLTEDIACKPVSHRKHQRLCHGDLLLDCAQAKRRYVQVSEEQVMALAGWQVPVRSNKYIPRLLARALSRTGKVNSTQEHHHHPSMADCDQSLLSSAARILYKQWDI